MKVWRESKRQAIYIRKILCLIALVYVIFLTFFYKKLTDVIKDAKNRERNSEMLDELDK